MVNLSCCCCCCCCWTARLVIYQLYKNVRILPQYIFTASLSLHFRNSTDGWRSRYKWNGKYMKSLFNKRRWRESDLIPPYWPYSQGNPCQVIFRSLPASEIRWSTNSQSCGAMVTHVDNPVGFPRNARGKLSEGELDTISKGNLRGYLGYQVYMRDWLSHSSSSLVKIQNDQDRWRKTSFQNTGCIFQGDLPTFNGIILSDLKNKTVFLSVLQLFFIK